MGCSTDPEIILINNKLPIQNCHPSINTISTEEDSLKLSKLSEKNKQKAKEKIHQKTKSKTKKKNKLKNNPKIDKKINLEIDTLKVDNLLT